MHTSRTIRRATPQLVLGIIIVGLGLLFLLDNFQILHAASYWHYWPVLLIMGGLLKLFDVGDQPGKVWGGLLGTAGVVLLLDNLDVIHVDIWKFWPVFLIVAGSALVWHVFNEREVRGEGPSFLRGTAILGGFAHKSFSQDFRGANFFTFMGGCEVDFREASIQQGVATIDCFALMGGIEIKVPEEWIVIIEALPLLGGVENRTRSSQKEGNPKLIVKGMALMGGIEVKN